MNRICCLVFLALALVACNKAADTSDKNPPPAGGPTASEADLQTATQSYDASASAVRDGISSDIAGYLSGLQAPFTLKLADFLGLPDFFGQVGGLIGAQGVSAQANSTLPRGIWDCTSGDCLPPTVSDDYKVTWKTGGKIAEIFLDWDGSSVPPASPTVTGHPAADLSSNVEAPTKLIGSLTLADDANGTNKKTLMTLNRTIKYPDKGCGPIVDVPDSQTLKLTLNRTDGSSILKVNNFETTILDTSIATRGDIAANSPTDGITAKWDLTTSGMVIRASCGQYAGLSANNLAGTLTTGNGTHTLSFSVGANKFSQNPNYIVFTGSTLTMDGGKTVRFSGSTQDTNQNGYIGDALTISFASGLSTTLEAYLQKYHKKL